MKVHLTVGNEDLRLQLERALKESGFHVELSEGVNPNGSYSDLDLFVVDHMHINRVFKTPAEAIVKVGNLELHTLNFETFCSGEKIRLTTSEFQMLKILCENRPKVMSREHLVKVFTSMGLDLSLRTIDNHIFNLRKKLGPCEEVIETIRGVGYKVKNL